MTPPPHLAEDTGVEREHLAVIRKLGALQGLVTQMQRRQQRLHNLERHLMAQSVRLVLHITRLDWGLGWPAADALAQPGRPRPFVALDRQTQAVICTTGCAMDTFHWRSGAQCRLLQSPCLAGSLAGAGAAPVPTPPEALYLAGPPGD